MAPPIRVQFFPTTSQSSEFRDMVSQIRLTEAALGKVNYEMTPKKHKSRQFVRSLYTTQDIDQGELFTAENVRFIRPGFGAPPKILREKVIGKVSVKSIPRGTHFSTMFIQDFKKS